MTIVNLRMQTLLKIKIKRKYLIIKIARTQYQMNTRKNYRKNMDMEN